MWTGKQTTAPTAPGFETPTTPVSTSDAVRPGSPVVRTTAWLGPSVEVKGKISSNEDLHIDGKVDGPISLGNHRLTVGRTAQVSAEIAAREIVVYGKVNGNLRAKERIEIKKDGSVIGDLTTARIMVEDGAYFKGKIEIDRTNKQPGKDLESVHAHAASDSG